MSCGACAATSSTCPPTARNATNGSAGRATCRCSRRPRAFLYDCRTFIESWLADLAVEQAELGTVPPYVPWVQLMFPPKPAAAWGDAAVIVPWVLYERYGDIDMLRRALSEMRSMGRRGRVLGRRRSHCGTPASSSATGSTRRHRPIARPTPGPTRTSSPRRTTPAPPDCVASRGRSARPRGLPPTHHALADAVVAAFNREFVTPIGPTGQRLTDRLRPRARVRPAPERDQRATAGAGSPTSSGSTTTGSEPDSSARHSCAMRLAATGFVDDAYHLLTQEQCPSWLYPVTMGATTIWERWDSMLPDGSDQHWRDDLVQPLRARRRRRLPASRRRRARAGRTRATNHPGAATTRRRIDVGASELMTGLGEAAVAWRREGETLHVDVTVPDGRRGPRRDRGLPTSELAR